MSLLSRGRSVEEAWAKEMQEVAAAAHLERLLNSEDGEARLAATRVATFSSGILPSIAAHYLRLEAPKKVCA
jgi:hypothetical protein